MANAAQGIGTTIAERLVTPVSQFTELLAACSRGIRVSLECVVVSFDSVKQTVVVQPTITERTRTNGVIKPVQLPQLTDVPILMPRAGGFTMTMPITAGDECLVVFADTCIDAWWQSGGVNNNQVEQRRHSLSDGIAIFGPWSQPNVLASYSTSSVQLRSDDGTVILDVAADAITVTAPTVTVNAPTINVAGSTAVNITGGHCSIDGQDFLLHDHFSSGITGPTTGPVAP
jgi:hypothetical protein